MSVISDSSPLILYGRIGRLDLLRRLFVHALVPSAVRRELAAPGATRPDVLSVTNADWIREQPVSDWVTRAALAQILDLGEAEVITLAIEMGSQISVLMDDLRGRRRARERGLAVRGSAGALVLAKERHLIPEVRPVLDELRSVGLYLSDDVYRTVLGLATEQ